MSFETQNIKHDSYDSAKFHRMVSETELNSTIVAGVREYPVFPELVQDVFYSLFKFNPTFQRADARFLLNRTLIQKLQGSQQYAELHMPQ